MTEQRPRRIVRRAVMALASGVLALAVYVAWWVLWQWDVAGPRPLVKVVPAPPWVFLPLELYASGRLPGSDQLFTLHEWSQCGGTASWDECWVVMQYNKYGIDLQSAQPPSP